MSAGNRSLVDGVFAAIDAQDVDRFVGFLTDDARFRFGSAPAVSGSDAIRIAVGEFFESIAALEHRIDRVLEDGATLLCEGAVRYTRHDGSDIALPFADVFELVDGRIADYKIYMDINPLYAS